MISKKQSAQKQEQQACPHCDGKLAEGRFWRLCPACGRYRHVAPLTDEQFTELYKGVTEISGDPTQARSELLKFRAKIARANTTLQKLDALFMGYAILQLFADFGNNIEGARAAWLESEVIP